VPVRQCTHTARRGACECWINPEGSHLPDAQARFLRRPGNARDRWRLEYGRLPVWVSAPMPAETGHPAKIE